MAGRASIICTPCQPFLIIFYLSRFRYKTVSDTEYTISETTLLIFLLPPFALSLRWLPIALAQILQSLRLRNLRFHLHDQHLQLLLALLAGVGIDIARVLFAVGPLGGVASLKETVVDLGDTASARLTLAAHIGLEIGHTRLFRLDWGSFLPRL